MIVTLPAGWNPLTDICPNCATSRPSIKLDATRRRCAECPATWTEPVCPQCKGKGVVEEDYTESIAAGGEMSGMRSVPCRCQADAAVTVDLAEVPY